MERAEAGLRPPEAVGLTDLDDLQGAGCAHAVFDHVDLEVVHFVDSLFVGFGAPLSRGSRRGLAGAEGLPLRSAFTMTQVRAAAADA